MCAAHRHSYAAGAGYRATICVIEISRVEYFLRVDQWFVYAYRNSDHSIARISCQAADCPADRAVAVDCARPSFDKCRADRHTIRHHNARARHRASAADANRIGQQLASDHWLRG